MIVKAQKILAKAQPIHAAETANLTLLIARSVHILEHDAKKAQEMEEAQARLVDNIAKEKLKKQAVARAEDNKRNRLSLEVKLQLYTERQS